MNLSPKNTTDGLDSTPSDSTAQPFSPSQRFGGLRRNWESFFAWTALGSDVLVTNACFLLAYFLRYPSVLERPSQLFSYLPLWAAANGLFLLFLMGLGIYRHPSKLSVEGQLSMVRKAVLYASILIMSFIFLSKGKHYSRMVVGLFFVLEYVGLSANRVVLADFNRWMRRKGYGVRRFLVVGPDGTAVEIIKRFREYEDLGYKLLGFVSDDGVQHAGGIPPLCGIDELGKAIVQLGVERVLIAADSPERSQHGRVAQICAEKGVELSMVAPWMETILRHVQVRDLVGIAVVSPPRRFKKEKLEAILKRTFDVVGASVLLVLFSPFFALVAAAIKLTSRGPVFFKQKRSLSDRAPAFEFYKFRTMKVGADLEKMQMARLNESNGALFKIRDDPRITEVGRILRKHSIDELPQLINVLKGEMSLVGPRPLPVEDYANVEAETKEAGWYRYRAKARPGMTGLWQIGGRSDVSFEEMALLDMYYVENQSFLFDIEILLETVPCVLLGKGAY